MRTTVSKHILDEEFEDDKDVVWSESAGQFVCNETIYRTLYSIEKLEKKTPAILSICHLNLRFHSQGK